MYLADYSPIPTLVTKSSAVTQPRFPVVDAHNHIGGDKDGSWFRRSVRELLDRCPNFNIDISARIAELGRQPYTARRFFLRYADRILFGIDQKPDPAWYRVYYRFLETDDEYFNQGLRDTPTQGRWRIYGLFLPDDVLEKVYRANAERLIARR